MSNTIYPLRLSPDERSTFKRAAKSEGRSLAEFFRLAALSRARSLPRRPANLDYPDKIELSAEAEKNPRSFIQRQMEAKRELYR